jgi:3-isopropylmalate dehydrogenase
MGLMPSASVGELYEPFMLNNRSTVYACRLHITIGSNMMFEDAFGLHEEAATIRAAVNKSLEQGIVTEDLAAKGTTAYKTSDIEIG